jgi:hypothetical protein
MVDVQVSQQNLLEGRNIEAASPNAFEASTARIDEKPWLPVDGEHVPGRDTPWTCDRAATAENGER